MKKIYLSIILIITLLLFLWVKNTAWDSLQLSVDENNVLEVSYCQYSIKGWNDDDVTYFFLPSFFQKPKVKIEDQNIHIIDGNINNKYFAFEWNKGYNCEIINQEQCSTQIVFMKSSNLPTIFLNLEEEEKEKLFLDKSNKAKSVMEIVDSNGRSSYKESLDYVTCRGNSTWLSEKKSYNIKLPNKESLLGMKERKKWELLSNVYEGTKLMNKIAFGMAEAMQIETVLQSTWVDLYLNGEYQGNYLLVEDREAIGKSPLKEANKELIKDKEGVMHYADEYVKGYFFDSSNINYTGTYLIEKTTSGSLEEEDIGFTSEYPFIIKQPDIVSVDEAIYIRDFLIEVEKAIREDNWENYIDAESFAAQYLVEEIAQNDDGLKLSAFYYKKQNEDRLYAGPVWDYDGGFGEGSNIWDNWSESVLELPKHREGSSIINWHQILLEDERYFSIVKQQYQKLLPYLNFLLSSGIDEYAYQIHDSVNMDMKRWNYAGVQAGHYYTFDNNIRFLKYFIAQRIKCLNEWFGITDSSLEDINLSNGEMHQFIVNIGNERYYYNILDGECIELDMIPQLDEELYEKYCFSRDNSVFNAYFPIYEDMEIYALEKMD